MKRVVFLRHLRGRSGRLPWLMLALWLAALALNAAPKPASATLPTLPDFNGWHKDQSAITRPPAFAPAVAAELRLRTAEAAHYSRGDHRWQLDAELFADASGAYGAFTLERPQVVAPVDLQRPHGLASAVAVSDGTNVYLYEDRWTVHVRMDQLTAMSAGDIRALANALPVYNGPDDVLPTLLQNLPERERLANTERYMEGPAAFAQVVNWAPAAHVGFDSGAEAVSALYDLPPVLDPNRGLGPRQRAQLVILSYPTPRMAMQFAETLGKLPGVLVRRSGPLLAVEHGAVGTDAQALVNGVNYEAQVTLTQPIPIGIESLPSLILTIFALCGVIILIALVVGILTGGLRVALRRWFPRWFKSPEEADPFIRLDLHS